jgi:hypothetical protein
MRAFSSHGWGLTPDTSALGVAGGGRLAAKGLHAGTERVPSGRGWGLTPDTASGDAF